MSTVANRWERTVSTALCTRTDNCFTINNKRQKHFVLHKLMIFHHWNWLKVQGVCVCQEEFLLGNDKLKSRERDQFDDENCSSNCWQLKRKQRKITWERRPFQTVYLNFLRTTIERFFHSSTVFMLLLWAAQLENDVQLFARVYHRIFINCWKFF